MRKVKKLDLHETAQGESDESTAARIIPLRTETALSRFPLHQLAKKGTVKKIQQRKKDAQGKTVTTWQVTNPPGPLAYKVDSIVVTQRIDESRPHIPKTLRLGSLRDICKEIGISPEGKNTQAVKEALRENAFAGITACLDYKGQDGTERHFEFSDTRYGLILTGETLPNGQRADAVYINLHDIFLSLLMHSQTRPLDYEYLRQLPPAAQRLYELLSFVIFGALRHGRDCATMLYSQFCTDAPLTRYYEWEKAKKQLYKLHKPHLESGYLKTVDFEKTTDADGRADWIIRYTPGPKARREFREFTKSRAKKREESAPRPAPRLVSAPVPPIPPDLGRGPDHAGAEDPLVSRLVAEGFGVSTAQYLVDNHREECRRQLDVLPSRDLSKVRDRVAWLRRAIEQAYDIPVETTVKQEKVGNTAKAADCKFCKDNHASGMRWIIDKANPRGAWKRCTHDPEIETAFPS